MLALVVIACTVVTPERHQLDRAEQEMDSIDPAIPEVDDIQITRGNGHGCGDRPGSCDELGLIIIELHSNDDRTPQEEIGYTIELTEGAPEIDLPEYPVRAPIVLSWVDGASDEQEGLDFTIRIKAMDLGGNESTGAINIPILDGNRDGCSCRPGARTSTRAPALLALAALAALTSRRFWRGPAGRP